MNNSNIIKIKAVLLKDLRSEFRTRYGISAVSLFILSSITMLVFSTANEKLSDALYAGLLWVIMFFSSMTGLSKSFINEEEKQTSLLLKLSTTSSAVYFGKLLFNIILSISLNTLAVLLFIIFFTEIEIRTVNTFILIHLLGSLGLACASTIISAIIAKAKVKNSLFTVLAFPILLPLIIIGIEGTRFSLEGVSFQDTISNFQMLLAYCGVLISISYIVFDMIWED